MLQPRMNSRPRWRRYSHPCPKGIGRNRSSDEIDRTCVIYREPSRVIFIFMNTFNVAMFSLVTVNFLIYHVFRNKLRTPNFVNRVNFALTAITAVLKVEGRTSTVNVIVDVTKSTLFCIRNFQQSLQHGIGKAYRYSWQTTRSLNNYGTPFPITLDYWFQFSYLKSYLANNEPNMYRTLTDNK